MAIILNGTTGITTPDIDSTAGFDGEDLTGDVAAARITGALNATGSAPIYACRAWVNFNGTGTVAIRASGNVSSITDNGTGNYTVNFTTAMPDADYSAQVAVGVTGNVSGSNPEFYGQSSNFLTTSVRAQSRTATGGTSDTEVVSVTICR